jgi:hypothetical protein
MYTPRALLIDDHTTFRAGLRPTNQQKGLSGMEGVAVQTQMAL